MDLNSIKQVYFIGIGGIGMSALARFFAHYGTFVAGYDRTPGNLTRKLENEGMKIHYSDDLSLIPLRIMSADEMIKTLIIYTPAVPDSHKQMSHFRNSGYTLMKRAEVLGLISQNYDTIAVAGSHGKSTISSMLAAIFNESAAGCSAFLGAISKNLDSNLSLSENSTWAVMEADEFDRSFLHLKPSMALVTSMDPDHLDIYGAGDKLKESFVDFLGKLKEAGTIIIKEGLDLMPPPEKQSKVLRYGLNNRADYYAKNLEQMMLGYSFDLVIPSAILKDIAIQIPGWINVENAVGAAALCLEAGLSADVVRRGLWNFKGVKRRFDVRYNKAGKIYIDDYAHHPKEIKALCQSIRKLFPGKKVVGVFQPHLFSRTRDFASDFANELSVLDDVALMPVYPAREEPIPGVNAEMILDKLSIKNKGILTGDEVKAFAAEADWDIFLTIGAGDIDRLVEPIVEVLNDLV